VLIAMLALLALASFEAVTPLSEAARALSATLTAGRRILELTAEDAAVHDPPDPAPAPVWPFTIGLEGVCATYPHQPRPALQDLTLTLTPGDTVALVGRSGAGKTTVANCCCASLTRMTAG
jgi:ABC-type transport system involved in cytochrome bd biosynthesis fused ATPase/permease subunit